MRAASLLGGLAALGIVACATPPKDPESEAPLAMADSARAHSRRVLDSFREGDSAAYMAAYPEDVVLVFNGQIFKGDRDQYARSVGEQMRPGKMDASFSDEHIQVVGPRAVVASHTFTLTVDSAGKTKTRQGAWSGVLGIRDGRTVIMQQHLSHLPPAAP